MDKKEIDVYNLHMSDKLLTPQQELFLERYTNPKSPTFGNAKQSALEASYSEEYSDNIMSLLPDWLSENIGDMKRLRRAEKNLDEVQNIQIYNDEGKIDANLVDKRTKVDMFIAERLNKQKYSTKVEQELYIKELPKPILNVIQPDNGNSQNTQAQ
jgi:hypothetical protein